MKQQLIENVKKDTSGKWINIADVEQLVASVVNESIVAVSKTGTQCAFTTHDLTAVQCTIARSVQTLKDHFGVK